MEWHAGDIAGFLPFSRMNAAPGDTISGGTVETLSISPSHFPEMIRECPAITAICVHVMLDRSRVFTTNDWQQEKVASLGKLAAGLAHELNNPASAVARGGKRLRDVADDSDAAVRKLALAMQGPTAAAIRSTQGPVRPVCEQGSSVQYSVAPRASDPA